MIDHLFIFSSNQGTEANKLVQFGLKEGSSRVHPGQGTTNRKFYFENFFLEVLWVHDESEIRSPRTSMTNLWERANFKTNQHSPFGLCLENTDDTDELFVNAKQYLPAYFPDRKAVEFIDHYQLPWLFRLPFKGEKKRTTEPLDHPKQLKQLTKTTFQIPHDLQTARDIEHLSNGQIEFIVADEFKLILEFDDQIQKQSHDFQGLALEFRY